MHEMIVGKLWDTLIDTQLFTEEELSLLTAINGYSVETLNDAIYVRYGYSDYNQMMSEEVEENKNGGRK